MWEQAQPLQKIYPITLWVLEEVNKKTKRIGQRLRNNYVWNYWSDFI